jgi:signal transduction histidine kinase/DNA-binding NarL/FixJ family response regulator
MTNEINASILVIDDEELVRDNIEDILVPKRPTLAEEQIDQAADILFDEPAPLLSPLTSNIPPFTVDKAINGMEGLELVKRSLQNNNPYAVIFLDMRMPGWDGLETAIQIRKFDIKAEIIFITAFTDRSIEEIVDKAGQNVGYHCKPYANEEILQLATKGVTDYSRMRNLEKLIESISSIGLNEQQLTSLLKNILDQLAMSIDTDMALMGKLHDDLSYEKVLSIGAMEERIDLAQLTQRIQNLDLAQQEVLQIDELVVARLNGYSIFAVLKKQGRLKTERMYLLKLFVQNAAQAIRNAELNEELLRKEKLSAVGNAIGMVMHDLRSPIKNIRAITTLMRGEGLDSEWLDVINASAHQAEEIFEDFLDFIKDNSIHKELLSIEKVIDSVLTDLSRNERFKQVNINLFVQAGLMVMADQSKLKRILSNLLNNAMEVLLDHDISSPVISIQISTEAENVIIEIKDNGPGIPQGLLKTLFEPFVTANKSQGTGLGLAIVKQFVVKHGGHITVENKNGALFRIVLPGDL